MASIPLSLESAILRDTHMAGELLCPTCDQLVTPEKFEEIEARLSERAEIVQREYARKIEDTEAKARADVDKAKKEAASAVETAKREAATREATIREEGRKAERAAIAPKLAEMEEAKKVAEEQAEASKENQDKLLQEQRDAFGKAMTEAVNAEKSKSFNHNQKLEEQVQKLQRQLQEKTTHELGEGAEIDLFEELRRAFPGDQIDRVAKGVAGADIIHKVMMNRKVCGSIIYDAKNRGTWQHKYATKLRQDQMAAKADHAILSTAVFPKDAKQIHVQDDVILLNPARVIAMVHILRKEIVGNHVHRLSDEEKTEKTARLYTFIRSDRCTQFFQQHESFTHRMLDLEVKETRAHHITWKNRGEMIKGQQKLFVDF